MPRKTSPQFVLMMWRGNWTLYRKLKAKHGDPPAHDLSEWASEARGNLEVWDEKPESTKRRK